MNQMGILSKLKDIISKGDKSIESLKQVDEELSILQKKINAEIIAIIGTGGRLKGLPLIYITPDEADLKKLSAKLSELVNPIKDISEDRNFRDFIINFDDSILFFKPIMREISIFAILLKNNDVLTLKQWIYKNELVLKELFHEKA